MSSLRLLASSRVRRCLLERSRVLSASLTTTSSSTPDDIDSLVNYEVKPLQHDDGQVGVITLNSPATYNALTVEVGVEFSKLCRDICHDPHLSAVIVTGAGGKAFSAGGNFQWLHSLRDQSVHANTDAMLQFYRAFLGIRKIAVPTIAAMPGPAVGAGAGLALACDLRTAVPHKKLLGLNFTRLGIHAGMGTSHLLEKALGSRTGILNEILLTGKTLSGEECLELGLVNRLSDDSFDAAWELAEELATRHPVAVRTMLQTLRQKQDEGLEQALQREAFAQAVCYARQDWGVGVDAVAEKREPVFDPYHSH